jgi:inosine-uridine nucleoside N-ribohydrolase
MTWQTERIHPRARVIVDNDYCGDPDGLVELAHHLLSPTVDLRLVIGSAVASYHPQWSDTSADESVTAAVRVAALAGRGDIPILPGSNDALRDPAEPMPTPAAEAIVAEALRDDTDLPLFVACGGGLTNVVSAWLMEPGIAERLTVVWIGAQEPDTDPSEHNTTIDVVAAQALFNDASVPLWLVPREAYAQVLASRAELLLRMRPHGPLGAHLYERIGQTVDDYGGWGIHLGETYVLGDNPLVLLTALRAAYDREPTSCTWTTGPRPRLLDSRRYEPNDRGAPARIFTQLDARLLLEDLYAKLALHAAAG